MNYLEKAAEHIEQAAKQGSINPAQRDLECARAYAALAAIDKGLLPEPVAEEIYKGFGGAS
ncbi:MAG: hypothetical protein ACRD0P_14620 [Stackebrandtia sp.]